MSERAQLSDLASAFPEDLPGLQELWAETSGSPDVCIAVLDGVVDQCHPCFRGANLQSANPLNRASVDDWRIRSHGTAVASVLFGQRHGRVRGIAPGCRGLLIPIYRAAGKSLQCSQDDLAVAIREAVRLGADVINVSGGELAPDGVATSDLTDAVHYCASKGRLLVAASGNDGCRECLHVPGALPNVLVVGATDRQGRPLAQSNWGSIYRTQGIVALGQNILVAAPSEGYSLATGTSLSTPVVTGVVALLASLQRRTYKRPDLALIRQLLLTTATSCVEQEVEECDRLLFGRLNIARAHLTLLQTLKGTSMADTCGAVKELPDQLAIDKPSVSLPPPTGAYISEPEFVTPSIVPADCGCGGKSKPSEYVYVIGDRIGYDFGTRVRQLSLEAHAFTPFDRRSLAEPAAFLRYLLGSNKPDLTGGGNLHDAQAVKWVLYQDSCPLYVLEPEGCFCEAAYKAIITFFIDTTFARQGIFGAGDSILFTEPEMVRYECLKEYFQCYGGLQYPLVGNESAPSKIVTSEGPEGTEKRAPEGKRREAAMESNKTTKQLMAVSKLMGEPLNRASKISVAGTRTHKQAVLSTGQRVEVIRPELRGMAFWSTAAFFSSLERGDLRGDPDTLFFAARVVSRLYELTRNDGKSPQDRAINYSATALLQNIVSLFDDELFRQLLGERTDGGGARVSAIRDTAVNDIQVRPSDCRESGGEFDVELSLFNVENAFRGLTVIANTVDVSDVVPVTLGKNRVFNKRN